MTEEGMLEQTQNRSGPVTVWEWLGTLVLLMIPIVNVVIAIVYALTGKESKRAFFKAWWILVAAMVLLGLILAMVLYFSGGFSSMGEAMRSMMNWVRMRI